MLFILMASRALLFWGFFGLMKCYVLSKLWKTFHDQSSTFPLSRFCLDFPDVVFLPSDSKPVNGESEAEKKDVVSEGESKDPKSAEEEQSDDNSQNNER